jgi:hypothetical protein
LLNVLKTITIAVAIKIKDKGDPGTGACGLANIIKINLNLTLN